MTNQAKNDVYILKRKESISYDNDYWWMAPKFDAHNRVFANAKEYFQKWCSNYYQLIGHKNRYEERDTATGIAISPWSKVIGAKYLSANVTASVIDTLVSMFSNVPSVEYVTSGGSYFEQQQAKDLQKYVRGVFFQKDVATNLRILLGDSFKTGTGFILLDHYKGQLYFQNFPAYQVLCDWVDAQSGNPIDIHFIDIVSRFKLMTMYPEKADELAKTSTAIRFYSETNLQSNDCVVLVKSYNLFARRRTICVENCTLEDDDTLLGEEIGLKDDCGNAQAPYVPLTYKDTSLGLFSIGLAEELRPLHDVVDKTLRVIQRSAHLLAVPKLLVNRQANAIESHFDNDIGGMIMVDAPLGLDQTIKSVPMGNIPTDLNMLVQYYYELAFKKAGLSQMSATSQKPAGLNSGKALMTYYDVNTERFKSTSKRYEEAVINLNYLTIKYSRYLQNIGFHQKARFYGRNVSQVLDFNKVDLNEEFFDIQAYPVSVIPQTPAGRYEMVRDMLQLGIVDGQRALKLLEIPDIESDTQIQTSQLDYARWQINEIMEGRKVFPEYRQDLNLLLSECTNHYLLYKQKNVPEDVLNRLSIFIEDINKMLARQEEAAQIVQQQMMAAQQEQGR